MGRGCRVTGRWGLEMEVEMGWGRCRSEGGIGSGSGLSGSGRRLSRNGKAGQGAGHRKAGLELGEGADWGVQSLGRLQVSVRMLVQRIGSMPAWANASTGTGMKTGGREGPGGGVK